jgi:hypothetical protein
MMTHTRMPIATGFVFSVTILENMDVGVKVWNSEALISILMEGFSEPRRYKF